MPSSGFSLGRFGWGLAKGAVKVTAATLCTVAIAALADKHACHSAQKRHQIPSLPRFRQQGDHYNLFVHRFSAAVVK